MSRFVADPDADENGNTGAVGMSAVDALTYKPSVRSSGQCRAKGSRERSVRVDGMDSLTGSQARMKVSRDGHLEARVSMLDWDRATGWSCDSVNSLYK